MGKQNSRRSPAFAKLPRGRQNAAIVPVALTIAGSDSSAGAGIQADLKTFSALGVYGLSALTSIVAEIPGKVSRLEPVSVEMVREQISVLAKHFPIAAIKTGLLCSAAIISAAMRRSICYLPMGKSLNLRRRSCLMLRRTAPAALIPRPSPPVSPPEWLFRTQLHVLRNL